VKYPRGYSLSGERFLNDEMRLVSARSNNAEAEDLRNDFGGFAGAVHALVGKLVGREPLCVERAEASFVAKKGPACHGHAAGKKNLHRGIEPKNGYALRTEKLGAARLRIGPPAKGEDGSFLELGGAAKRGAKLVGFKLAEIGFA
jgi:hypothetical protein